MTFGLVNRVGVGLREKKVDLLFFLGGGLNKVKGLGHSGEL